MIHINYLLNLVLVVVAQKYGLVEPPTQLLTDNEWKSVKEQSNAREDSLQPCVICKEDFGIDQQVVVLVTLHLQYHTFARVQVVKHKES